MENFNFKNTTKIIFGKNALENLDENLKNYKKILLHYEGDGALIKKLGIYEEVTKILKEKNIDFMELGGVIPNPDISLVYEGIKICKNENIDFILAIGGGSVIDSGKAISLGAVYEDDIWDFFTGKTEPKRTLGLGTILTIPGSGSEMSESAIVSHNKKNLKCVCDSEYNFPVFSILNPEVCYTIPKHLMACGVADIISHMMERYFSKSENVQLNNGLLESAMRIIIEFGPKILENPKDYNNCAQIMWGATIAHNGMIGAGKIADWSSHRIEHEISALYGITHGAGMAIIFPRWMEYVQGENIELFGQFARNVFGINENDNEKASGMGINALKNFFKNLGLKTKLSEYGIDNKNFEIMSEKALGGSETLGKLKSLNKNDIVNILELSK